MTKLDVKQYLEKIYNIPVVHVITYNKMGKDHFGQHSYVVLNVYNEMISSLGKTKTVQNPYVTKEPDAKIAFVTLVYTF